MKITFVEVRNVNALAEQNDLEIWFSKGMARRIASMNYYPSNFDVAEYLSKYLFRTGGWIQALSPHLNSFDQEVVWYSGVEKLENILDDSRRLILLSINEAIGYPIAQQFVHECRRYFPQHAIWVGGPFTSIFPDMVEKELAPDLLFVGEADTDIGGLVSSYLAEQRIPNRVVVNHCTQENLRQDWTLSLKYSAPLNRRTPFLLTSRDCVFDCAFCSIIKKGVMREYSLPELESSLGQLISQPGDIKIYIESPLPIASQQWRNNIIRLLGSTKITWYCDSRVVAPTPNTHRMFDDLYNAGCRDIYFGTETFDQSIHDCIDKRVDVENIVPLAKQAHEAGINVHTGWIVGLPQQTVESAHRDVDLVIKNLAAGIFSTAEYIYLTIFPGSRLFNEPRTFGIELVDWSLTNIANRPCHHTLELAADQIWDLYLEGLENIGNAQGF